MMLRRLHYRVHHWCLVQYYELRFQIWNARNADARMQQNIDTNLWGSDQ